MIESLDRGMASRLAWLEKTMDKPRGVDGDVGRSGGGTPRTCTRCLRKWIEARSLVQSVGVLLMCLMYDVNVANKMALLLVLLDLLWSGMEDTNAPSVIYYVWLRQVYGLSCFQT